MKKIFCLLCALFGFSLLLSSQAQAGNLNLSITAYDVNGNSISTANPTSFASSLSAGNVRSLDVTLSLSSGALSNFNITDSNFDSANWGVVFSTSNSATTVSCANNDTTTNCGSATVTVYSSPNVTLQSGSTSIYNLTDTSSLAFHVLITFPTPFNASTSNLASLLASVTSTNTARVSFYYAAKDPNSSTITRSPSPDYATWQPDMGTFLYGPTLTSTFGSVKPAVDGFQIINIHDPSSDAICHATAGACDSLTPYSGASDNFMTSTTGAHVSGYVIGIWNDSTCNDTNFKFGTNWYASTTSTVYPCTYSDIDWATHKASYPNGDTDNTTFGCTTTPTPIFTIPGTTLNGNNSAVPTLGGTNPYVDLQTLISNQGTLMSSTNSCMQYVYINSSRTYTFDGAADTNVYGVVVWALNSPDGTPNYSLDHSKVIYTQGLKVVLASLDKHPGLPLSKDCFVVTAASGDVNSPAVLYWRILRDKYLTSIGFTNFYYRHARTWAHWLDEHPSLKKPLNTVFEKTGSALVHFSEFAEKSATHLKKGVHKFFHKFSSFFDNTASAQEFNDADSSSSDNANKDNFGLKNTGGNLTIQAEDISSDEFFQDKKVKNTIKPDYEITILGGTLIPTMDSEYYKTYYSSATLFLAGNVSRVYWLRNLGISLGLGAHYFQNSTDTTVSQDISSNIPVTMSFYSIDLLLHSGLRYRNPNFIYLQPGLFGTVGVRRYRESIETRGSSSTDQGKNGITDYSPTMEIGTFLDVSLSAIAGQTEIDIGDILNEVLFRVSASYNYNPAKAISSTGFIVAGGFSFLLN